VPRSAIGCANASGFEIQVRVSVHRGLVYLDLEQDDVYGLAANMTARVSGLAPHPAPSSFLLQSSHSRATIFELDARPAQASRALRDLSTTTGRCERSQLPERRSDTWSAGQREMSYLQAELVAGEGPARCATPGLVFQGDAGIGKKPAGLVGRGHGGAISRIVLQLIDHRFHTDVVLRPSAGCSNADVASAVPPIPAQRLRLLEREVGERYSTGEPRSRCWRRCSASILGAGISRRMPMVATARTDRQRGSRVSTRVCAGGARTRAGGRQCTGSTGTASGFVQSLLGADLGGHVLIAMTSRGQNVVSRQVADRGLRVEPLNRRRDRPTDRRSAPEVTSDEKTGRAPSL